MIGSFENFRTSSTARLALPAMALALLCTACERPDHIEIDPRMPRLIHKGETVRLHGKMMDRQGHVYATERAHWTSRDPFIAAVDTNGEVAALSSGHTVITAHWEELTAEVQLEVDLVEAIRAAPDAVTIKVDADPLKLNAVALGVDGRPRADREVRMTSNEPAIARVDSANQVWGVAPGETIVHAKSDDKEAEIKVTVVKGK